MRTGVALHRGRRRWVYALSVASIAAWVAFFGLALFFQAAMNMVQAISGAGAADGSDGVLAVFAIFGIPVVVVVCFVTGIPALMLAERFKLSTWWQAALVGMAIGLILVLGLSAMSGTLASAPNLGHVLGSAIFMFTGACAGVTAWVSLWLDGKYRPAVRQTEA